MDDVSAIVAETAARLLRDHVDHRLLAEAEALPEPLWRAIEAAGLPLAMSPEAAGGAGLDGLAAGRLVRLAGYYAAPVPLGETMLAHRLLAEAGLAPPDRGPMAVIAAPGPAGTLSLRRQGSDWHLSGIAERVPWGRSASAVAVVAEAGQEERLIALAETAGCTLAHGTNLALEPRDSLGFDLVLPDTRVRTCGIGPGDVKLIGAALRSLAMAGAMERVLELTAGHVGQRVQFGRTLSKLQAVQQSMAVLAGQVAAAGAAADLAAEALAGVPSLVRVAAAKIRTGEAAGVAAGIAHQLHGAIGFSFEHALHFHTRRLWAWREEHGSEAEWSRALGTEVLGLDADELWPFVTAA